MKSIFISFACLVACGLCGQTREFFRNFDISEGMRTSTVYDLFTDEQGFLYLGTELGLSRFNGIEFTHFPLVNNRGLAIHNIDQDASGRIWCMNFGNQILYLDNDTLWADDTISEALQTNLRGFAVVEDELWIASDLNLYRYDRSEMHMVTTDTLRSVNYQAIHYCAANDRIVTIDDEHICFFDRDGRLSEKLEHQLRHVEFTCDSSGIYFTDKPNPKLIFTADTTLSIAALSASNYVNRIKKHGQGLHLCTNLGLYIIDEAVGGLSARMFENTRITDMAVDYEGGLWYSTIGKGVYYIPSPGITRLTDFDRPITALERGQNDLFYFGSNNGELVELSKNGDQRSRRATNYITEIEFIYYDSSNHRLLTSHGIFDPGSLDYTADRIGKSIHLDGHGNFIVRSFNKVLLINRDFTLAPNLGELQGHGEEVVYNNHPAFVLHDERSTSALWSKHHSAYFIGSSSGLHKIERNGNREMLDYDGRPIVATGISETPEGRILIATLQFGLLEFKNSAFHPLLNTKNGAGSNDILKASWTSTHGVFLTTESIEYFRWAPTDKHIRLSSYYPLTRLNSTAVLTYDETVVLATNSGLLSFSIPGENNENDLLLFSPRLQAGSKVVDENHAVLAHDDNSLGFRIELIDYRSMGDAMINYRLLGNSDEWRSQPASNPWVRFIALPPGDYQFEVFASSPGRTSQVQTFGFTVRKPYWLSWWFLGGTALISALLIMLGTWLILRERQQKQAQQELLLRSQLTALRSQMNPHFLFNALNSIQGMIYSNRKSEASSTLTNFAKLMRKILEFSEKEDITLEEELQLIESYLSIEAQRFDGNFVYEIQRNHPHELNNLRIPTMIVQPFVENSVKHGLLHKEGARQLMITTKSENGCMVISIRDNGIGRLASAQRQKKRIGKSFATGAISARVALLNKVRKSDIQIDINDLYSDTGIAEGTLVRLIIPLT